MDTPETVPASEFTRNFGRYRMRAQREAVAVSSHGQITGYFVGRRNMKSLSASAKTDAASPPSSSPRRKSKRSGPRAWIPGTRISTSCSTPNSGAACRSRSRTRSRVLLFLMPISGTTSTRPGGKKDKKTGQASSSSPSSAKPTAPSSSPYCRLHTARPVIPPLRSRSRYRTIKELKGDQLNGLAEYQDDFRRMAARGAASTVLALAENLPKIVDKTSVIASQDVE
jgi:hypothetical protein